MCDCYGNSYYTGSTCSKINNSRLINFTHKVIYSVVAPTLTYNSFCTATYMCDQLRGLSCQSNRCTCTIFSSASFGMFTWNNTYCA
jgi:hypothetical protein